MGQGDWFESAREIDELPWNSLYPFFLLEEVAVHVLVPVLVYVLRSPVDIEEEASHIVQHAAERWEFSEDPGEECESLFGDLSVRQKLLLSKAFEKCGERLRADKDMVGFGIAAHELRRSAAKIPSAPRSWPELEPLIASSFSNYGAEKSLLESKWGAEPSQFQLGRLHFAGLDRYAANLGYFLSNREARPNPSFSNLDYLTVPLPQDSTVREHDRFFGPELEATSIAALELLQEFLMLVRNDSRLTSGDRSTYLSSPLWALRRYIKARKSQT